MSDTNNEMNQNADELKADEVFSGGDVESRKTPTVEQAPPASSPETPALTSQDLATLDYVDFSTPARMLALGTVLAKSSLVPLKKAEDVAVALMTGKELGLPFVTSVSQIYPINGRPTLGVHIQKGILLKNGIAFKKIEDAVTIYEFVKTDKEGNILKETKKVKQDGKVVEVQVPIVLSQGTLEEQPENSAKRAVDTRTTYEFTRDLKSPSGKYREVTARSSFTIQQAREAELMEKDVWQKYWRRMLDARAFTIGAREIADDLLLGMMTPEEAGGDITEETSYIEVD